MASNKLSGNPNKNESLLVNPNNVNRPAKINLGSNRPAISLNDSSTNLGVMSINKHIASTVKSCYHQLRDFHRIRPFMYKTAAITSANALFIRPTPYRFLQ